MFTTYFDDLVYRSGRFQERAVEGDLSFYIYDEGELRKDLWYWKNEYDVMDEKDFKELIYINKDWKSMSYQYYLTQQDPNPTTVYESPNGYPYDNRGYFTQKQRYNSWYDWEVARANTHEIQWDATKYEWWKTSVEDVVWFDTKPCMEGPHIGDANKMVIKPKSTPTNTLTKWFKAVDGGPSAANYGTNNQVEISPNSVRYDAWDTDISVTGTIEFSDSGLYKDLLKDKIDLYEDCDADCFAKGSQLTIMAVLMSVAYGVVGLNALFMFIGTWRYRWRICSVYCTFAACILQFALLIAVGALMFTKYNAVCARSLYTTHNYYMYSMNDDFYFTFTSWLVSWIWMMVFVCCGLCSAYRPEK